MRKVSERKRKILKNQARIKKELIEEYGQKCLLGNHFCSSPQLVHIIRQSYSIELQDDKENCTLGCQDCHSIFDDGEIDEVMKLKGIEVVLNKMKDLDELYFTRFTCRT